MANNYQLGNIGFNIVAEAEKSFQIIDKLNAKLDALKVKLKSINSIDSKTSAETKRANSLAKSNTQLEIMQEKLNNIKLKNQNVNATLEKTKAQVSKINSQISLNYQKGVLNELKIQKANQQLIKTNLQLNKIKNSRKHISSVFRSILNLGKIYFVLNYTKRLANSIVDMAKKAIDFDETLNKFHVSMGEYYSDAIKFVNQLTYAFNISTKSVMNYMSTFKNMLDALGNINPSYTYKVSEVLTRMAIDYASLFNVSIDKAMEQFQGVLSGQIKFCLACKGLQEKFTSLINGKPKRNLLKLA